jgi:hypothetical protein
MARIYKQNLLVEFRNTEPFIYDLESEQPITMDRIVEYFVKVEDWNEERDSLTLLDASTVIDLDKK